MTNSMTLRVFFLLILVQIVTSANGRTLDEQAFSQVATINISNTQFPQGITIRGVGTRPFGLVGALIANQVGDADPTKQISEDITTAFRSALISYVEKAGYGTLTDIHLGIPRAKQIRWCIQWGMPSWVGTSTPATGPSIVQVQ